ncbi:MAG: alpha/beta hydrolase [Gammaproteobacteria bacterium]|nr:MAG: alpha/beta hydrolase [Gammaproteobacteria bacterium]
MKKISIFLVLIFLLGAGCFFYVEHNKETVSQLINKIGAQQAGLSHHTITINKHKIAYLENDLKDTKPTLLLVHGFGAFKENWILMILELRDDFHIISVDLPGHGESDFFADSNYDIDQQVTMLHEFANQVIGRPFYMVGNSMGGAITALYAATYPREITSAVLLNPGHITDIKSPMDLLREQGINLLIVENTEQFDKLVQFAMEQPPFLPWPLKDISIYKMAERKHKNEKVWIDISKNQNYNFKEEIKNIAAPTLIAWGKEDRTLNYKNAYIFDQLIPNSKIQIFEKIGHAPMIEAPEETAKAILDFFNSNASAR